MALQDIWTSQGAAWHVGYYLLMPDHLHLFCAPRDLAFDLDRWVAFWKRILRRQVPTAGQWQRHSFHHRVRSRTEFEEKMVYVQQNPVRRNLVTSADAWPYQGRVFEVSWWGE